MLMNEYRHKGKSNLATLRAMACSWRRGTCARESQTVATVNWMSRGNQTCMLSRTAADLSLLPPSLKTKQLTAWSTAEQARHDEATQSSAADSPRTVRIDQTQKPSSLAGSFLG